MRIKLYENRDFMRRTQIKLMQEEVHIWCIRWKEVIPVFEYYQLMLDQKEKEKTIQVLDIENPVEITYSADDGSSMSFVKEDGTWYLKNDKETALVQETIQDIADTVSDVKAEKQIKDPDPLESYGLNEASYTIIVTGENGDTGTLYIGDGADSDYYLTDKEKQNVYLVSSELPNVLDFDKDNLKQTEKEQE